MRFLILIFSFLIFSVTALAKGPSSVFISSSYTVPAGKWARVKPSGLNATLNGVEYLAKTPQVYSISTGTNHGFILPIDFNGRIQSNEANTLKQIMQVGTSGAAVIDNSLVAVSGTTAVDAYFDRGVYFGSQFFPNGATRGSMTSLHVGSSTASVTWTVTPYHEPKAINVPSGAVLGGCNWFIELYER